MTKKVLIVSEGSYFSWDTLGGWLEVSEPLVEQDWLNFGFDPSLLPDVTKEEWKEITKPIVMYYTDDPNQTEITIETETEPFTIYDEFGDSIEVLYYTDDPDVKTAELHIEANYSPLDELEGDYEVITWTDDIDSDLSLGVTGVPQPQFIHQSTPIAIHGYLESVDITEEVDNTSNGKVRYLISSDQTNWKKWDGTTFVKVDSSTSGNIVQNGMSIEQIEKITKAQWETWEYDKLYIGIYLEDKITSNNPVQVNFVEVHGLDPSESTKISDAKMYILNTASTIDVTFSGSTITGSIEDADEGKVQYRIILNGDNYYPADGSFTPLMASPLNISTTLANTEILIDQNNSLRIEFQDYWGAMDYWETNFTGTYSGLLFMDESGDYYSTEIGEVLKYLDFGIILAGQTTLEQKITLKNTYGYTVENIKIRANKEKLSEGVTAQFSTNDITFEALEEIELQGQMADGDTREFYVRLSTELGAASRSEGVFDIIVTADKVN